MSASGSANPPVHTEQRVDPSRPDGASPPAVDNSRLWGALPDDPRDLLAVVAKMPRGAPPPTRTRAKHRNADPAKNCAASLPVNPFPSGPNVDTGIVAAGVVAQAKAKNADPEAQQTEQPLSNSGAGADSSANLSLDFLDDFFGSDKRHLVGIKKPDGKGKRPSINAKHFQASDRAGQEKFIADCGAAGFDVYFSVNPIKGTRHKKAKKGDVADARYFWIDLDPRKGQPLDAERAAMLALLTTDLPAGVPRPNRVIDSGRGFWGYWKLDKPMPVDGAVYNDKGEFVRNSPLTDAVESYGRGIEQAFGDRFADGCRNIDRVARLPGTINRKTGQLARVLHEHSHDQPLVIESFPRTCADEGSLGGESITPSDSYEPVARDAPDLANIGPEWSTRIFDGDTEGKYQGDRSRLAFAVACELVRVGADDAFIARALMTTACGAHVQESPAYRLPRTIRRAHEFAIDPDLEAMNSKHAVLPIGDKTRVVTWDKDHEFPGRKTIIRAQSFVDFKNLHSNKRKIIETKDKQGNSKEIDVSLGTWWLSHPCRRQYDGGQRFMPQQNAEVVGNTLNMFEGFAVVPRKPDGGSGANGCQLMLDHGLKIMCSGNEEHWQYLLNREAWIAQNRRRSEVAAAYRTEAEGSGKGFWCNQLGRLYGRHYMQINKPEHVLGKFNPHLETLLKVCADEAIFVSDPRHRNALFGLTTEPTLTIEPKNINVYSAPNYLNIDMTTNARHFVPASSSARQFFVPTVSADRVGDLAYFNQIAVQLNDGGYEALLYHLLYEVDLREFDVRQVPKTAGLAEQVAFSRKGLDGLVEKVCSEGRVPCPHLEWPGFSVSNGNEKRESFDCFIDNHPDRELRDLGALKVKIQLRKQWGCMSGDDAKRRDGGTMVYGVKWPVLSELRARFIERHGPQDWLHPDVTEWPVWQRTGTDLDVGKGNEADREADAELDYSAVGSATTREQTLLQQAATVKVASEDIWQSLGPTD